MSLVIEIPGPWINETSLTMLLFNCFGMDYRVADGVLSHRKSGVRCDIEVQACHEEKATYWSRIGFTSDDAAGVAILKVEGHDAEAAEPLFSLAHALFKLGGEAVIIPAAGAVYTPKAWPKKDIDDLALYGLFVRLVEIGDDFISCGLAGFDAADATLAADIDAEEAAFILNAFNIARVLAKLEVEDGEVYQADKGGTVYMLGHETSPAPTTDPRFNQHGLWRLTSTED